MRVNQQTFDGASTPRWLAADEAAEVQKILRQNELAFRLFVTGCIVVCGLILAAMFLG